VGTAVGRSVAAGDGVSADAVGLGGGEGESETVGDGLAVGREAVGAAVTVADGGTGSLVGDGGADSGAAGRGDAASASVVTARAAMAAGVATGAVGAATGLAAGGGACVGTSTLGVSTGSPLHAASAATTSPRHTQRTAALAWDLARLVQRRPMVLNSRRPYRASGRGLTQAARSTRTGCVDNNNGRS